ncbi:hypothetical protein GJAV_G00203860 [Gymnothorax javanicus]|nr:hypothetical protein GJAV_G00203860 [Gymnothorax javanicus]
MYEGTRVIVYICVFLLVGHNTIQSGGCAPTQSNGGEGNFTIRHVALGLCLRADLEGLRLMECSGSPEEQWKWGSGHRLFHVVTAQCLGLKVPDKNKTLALLDCGSSNGTLSWRCEGLAVYVWSRNYLSVTDGKLVARSSSEDRWARDSSTESICQQPYQVVFTTNGNSFGAPCEFPFRHNGTWYHGCVPSDSYSWCSTTEDYDTDQKMGYCLKYEEGCGVHWKASASGFCYQHNTKSLVSWQEARATCLSQGGDLLSITSADELAIVNDGDFPQQMWIGLNQLDMSQGWQWSDGSPLTLVNWNEGMTSLSILKESDCAVKTAEGLWEKVACDNKLPFVCKKVSNQTQPRPTSPWMLNSSTCDPGWQQRNGFCYMMVTDQPLTQLKAQDYCGSRQAALISMHSLADLEAISDFHTDGGVGMWTGLRSEDAPASFQWMDKSPVSFSHWARDEPRVLHYSRPTCVSYSGELLLWRVAPCEIKRPFVCKKKGDGAEPVTNKSCPTNGEWKRHGNACYKVNPTKVLFKDRCNLTIVNRFEQAYINTLIRDQSEIQYFWVGLQDANKTGQYQWSSKDGPNARLTFSNWAKDEPKLPGQCAVMSNGKLTGKWEVRSCAEFRAGSVCKEELNQTVAPYPDPDPDPSLPCDDGWESMEGFSYCYKVFHAERLSRKRTWEEAERFCEALGGHLPSFSSVDEMEALHKVLRGSISNDRFFWVGLNRRNPASGNAWEWSDGRPVSSVIVSGDLQEDDEYNRDCVAFQTMKRSYLSMIFSLHGYFLRLYYAKPFHCDAQLEWVCQIPRGKKALIPEWYNPSGHHESSVFVDGNEFWFVSDPKLSFEEAGLYCSSNGSILASPQSSGEIGVIITQLQKISDEKQSWWVDIPEPELPFPLLFHPRHHPSLLGGCSSLKSDSLLVEREHRCDHRLAFVCEKVNITTVEKEPVGPHPGGLPCGNGSYAFRDKCYTVFKPLLRSFDKAVEHCLSLRGTLPIISNQAEQDFIISLLPDYLPRKHWIGLLRRQITRDWAWVDQSPVGFENFNTLLHGQMRVMVVNSFGNLDICAYLYNDPSPDMMGTWDYMPCSDKQYVAVCQHYADQPEKPKFPEGPFDVRNHTYEVLQKNLTWFAANEQCKARGMELASVADGYSQAVLTVATSRTDGPLWIGLFSEDDGVHYHWTDHSHTVFSRWFAEPTSGRCVYLDTDGFWKASECEEELGGAICHVPQEEKTFENTAVKCPHRANGPDWMPFRKHCYAFHREASRWAAFEKGDSRETCKKLDPNAEVLTIRDEEENEFVRKQLLRFKDLVAFVWIGIFKDNETNQLKWYDGTNVQYHNWKDGRPNITDKFLAGLSSSGTWKLFTNKLLFDRLKQVSVVACKIDYDPKENFSKYVSDFENYGSLKYKVIQKTLKWKEALRECSDMGGHLASAHDLAQDAHLQVMSKIDGFPLWIGLSSQDESGSSFEWSDGSAYDYSPLGFSYSASKGNCMLINRMGSWVQSDCSSSQDGAICYINNNQSSKPSPQHLNDCSKTAGHSKWVQYKDHCYAFDMALFNYSVYTMEEAKTICGNLDESAQLLSIKDQDENSFVSSYLKENPLITKRVWLGLDLDNQDESKWIDGTTVEFSNWDKSTGKLAGTDPGCAVLTSGDTGTWSRVSCAGIHSRVVCKVSAHTKRGSPAAFAFFFILVVSLIALVLLIIWKRRRAHFSPTVRYQRNFDEADGSNILSEMEREYY